MIIIIGRTGSGKDTAANYLCEKYQLSKVISYTTRPYRDKSEIDVSHHFITPEQSKQFQDKVSTTVINGYEYFTTANQIYENEIYIVDPAGLYELCDNMPNMPFDVVYIDRTLKDRRNAFVSRGKEETSQKFKDRNDSENIQFTQFEREIMDSTIYNICPGIRNLTLYTNDGTLDDLYKKMDIVYQMSLLDKPIETEHTFVAEAETNYDLE